MKLQMVFLMLAVAGLVGMVTLGVAVAAETKAPAAGSEESATTASPLKGLGSALGAGVVGGLSILGAGIAVGRVGSAAVGAITEKPELFVRALIFVVIAEGLAGLGFGLAYVIFKL
jgi:V/A-type H+/Na+-transporting ATPase subunit K